MNSDSCIGIFDSGVGGLTVASAISDLLPHENIVYFGDTLHLPYGEKSAESIQRYSREIVDFLVSKSAKMIVIACNSASAVANETILKHLNDSLPVINVIDPMVDFVKSEFKGKSVGVIGTKATISSGVYEKRLEDFVQIYSKATPLLAPMIEEGFIHDQVSSKVIESYLSDRFFRNIDALILGCTHYPLIHNDFEAHYVGRTDVLDSSEIVAHKVKKDLAEFGIANRHNDKPTKTFYISDSTPSFKNMANAFFGKSIEVMEQRLA